MMPGSFDVDDPVDIGFANFTYSDRQCFHARSPHLFCAHKAVPVGRDLAYLQVRRSRMQHKDPAAEPSIPAGPQFPAGTESLRPHKTSAADAVTMRTTRRVLARPAIALQQESLPCGDKPLHKFLHAGHRWSVLTTRLLSLFSRPVLA